MLAYESLPDERKELIKSKLKASGKVIAADLSRELNVSIHTVRRDLVELAEAGVCKRVYGGALSLLTQTDSFAVRTNIAVEAKKKLAITCQELVLEHQCLFIDAGSTNLAIARELSPDLKLTVVTNSPLIAGALMEAPNIEVVLLGGVVDRKVGGVVGVSALEKLSEFVFDLTFLGACAVDQEHGLTAVSFDDAAFKKEVVARSKRVVVAVLSDKLNLVAPFQVSALDKISTLVLEKDALRNSEDYLSDTCTLLFSDA